MTSVIGRRAFVGGGVAAGAALLGVGGYVAAVDAGADLPAGARIRRFLGACGDDPGLPDQPAGELVSGTIDDGWLAEPSEWIVSYPTGMSEQPMPVIVVLHGAQGFASHAFETNHGLDRFQNQVVADGAPPFALALVDGFETLWFDRVPGDQPQSLVVEGLVPRLADMGLDTARLGVYGWGTGGFGALRLVERLGLHRVAAVGALSPAIFPAWDFVDGYYDDEAEFVAHQLDDLLPLLEQVPLRVDCGTEDPFVGPVRAFRDEFTDLPGAITEGCRDQAYWHQRHPLMLQFIAARLA